MLACIVQSHRHEQNNAFDNNKKILDIGMNFKSFKHLLMSPFVTYKYILTRQDVFVHGSF